MTEGTDRFVSRQCTYTTSANGVLLVERFSDVDDFGEPIASELETNGDQLVRSSSETPRFAILDEGGERSYKVIGRTSLESVLPGVQELYESVRQAAESTLALPVLPSTHEESSVTAKTYGPGDSQGWHLDTNPVTALLLLRVSPGVPPILWEDERGRVNALACAPGDLAIFEGKRIRHCVPLHHESDTTVMILFNLYLPDDSSRPDEMDQFALLGDEGVTVPPSVTGYGDVTKDSHTYLALARREPNWWIVTIPELDITTQARRIHEVKRNATEAVAAWLDVGVATVSVEVEL